MLRGSFMESNLVRDQSFAEAPCQRYRICRIYIIITIIIIIIIVIVIIIIIIVIIIIIIIIITIKEKQENQIFDFKFWATSNKYDLKATLFGGFCKYPLAPKSKRYKKGLAHITGPSCCWKKLT